VLPGVGHVELPSVQGQACFVSDHRCSLTPCRGFVSGSPDWVPITPQCGSQRLCLPGTALERQGSLLMLLHSPLLLPRLVARPGR